MEENKMSVVKTPPCKYMIVSKREKDCKPSLPQVNCEYYRAQKNHNSSNSDYYSTMEWALRNCETCGWNPEEQKRRIETGHMEIAKYRMQLDENGEIAYVPLPEGCKRLVFKRKPKNG